jgi:protein TonB
MPYAVKQNNTGKLIGLAVTVVVHVAVIYAIMTGLAMRAVEIIKGPIETEILDEQQPEEDRPPPPPPPKFEAPPPPFIPPPEIAITAPTPTAITQVTREKPVEAPPPPPRTPPKADPRRPNGKPDYPPTSQRLGEEGAVILDLFVGDDGRVKEAKVATSSGFERLDEAAVKEALRSYRFIPGTENGKPASMWHQIRVVFRLQDANR